MLLDELKNLPTNPGVYQYFDNEDRLLYVGKAKNLKNRVKSYFSFTPTLTGSSNLSPRIAKMISETSSVRYIITNTEADALILENSFIKQLKPKYNILLRDDKTYPYIYINFDDDFPTFKITRKIIKGLHIKYYGPFFSGAKELLNAIYLNYKLVQKDSCLKSKKACLFYQINRCHAPCESKISKDEYLKIVKEATNALLNPEILISRLSELMMIYAKLQNYEQAAITRDQINHLKNMQTNIEVDIARLEDFDVFCVASDKDMFCSVRFSIQSGKIVGVKTNLKSSKDAQNSDKNEIYRHTILDSFGVDEPIISTKIYTLDEFEDMGLVCEILSKRHTKKFQIQSPKIGEKRKICEIALKNAELAIQNHIKINDSSFLEELRDYFGFVHTPYEIECFDNSHLFGEANVGAFIRYENGEFNKQKYRHMHLNSKNDYDQMRESLVARALRFDKLAAPDLWVIDGGQALLNLAYEILSSSGVNIDVIAISKEKVDAKAYRSKGGARDKIYTKNGTFSLSVNDKKLLFFQKIRDEAHRFAISFHRKVRDKTEMQSSKLKSLGISDAQISKLVKFYGSFDKIYNATYDEIAKLTNKNVAQKISKEKS